jgi:raffinose/stachyose/melibiose transport system permease protein
MPRSSRRRSDCRTSPTLDNLQKVWDETNFIRYMLNSLLRHCASLALILIFGTMAAYAIARYEFRMGVSC